MSTSILHAIHTSNCVSCLIPTSPFPTRFFSSCAGFLLNTGSTVKMLTLLLILYITHSLHIYILAVLSDSCSFHTFLQYQSAHRSIYTALGACNVIVISPEIWNSLPLALCSCNCSDTSSLLPASRFIFFPPCALDAASADIAHIYKFHLFTY